MSSEKPSGPVSGKRARTRERLLDVAVELFRERGISGTSLDEIASRAGMTKGAIYGNFAGKDDLVFTVVVERSNRSYFSFDGETPIRTQLQQMAHKAFDISAHKRGDYAFRAELDRYSFGREELSRRFVAASRAHHERSAKTLEAFRGELKLPPLQFTVAVQAILGALQFQHACHPGMVTEETALVALESLLRQPAS